MSRRRARVRENPPPEGGVKPPEKPPVAPPAPSAKNPTAFEQRETLLQELVLIRKLLQRLVRIEEDENRVQKVVNTV